MTMETSIASAAVPLTKRSLLSRLADKWLSREQPENPTDWHRWAVFFPLMKLTDGTRYYGNGQLWRRQVGTTWEYRADKPTYDDWEDLQW